MRTDRAEDGLLYLLETGMVSESPAPVLDRRVSFRRQYDGLAMLRRRLLTLAADADSNGAEEKAARPKDYSAGYFQGQADALRLVENMLRRTRP